MVLQICITLAKKFSVNREDTCIWEKLLFLMLKKPWLKQLLRLSYGSYVLHVILRFYTVLQGVKKTSEAFCKLQKDTRIWQRSLFPIFKGQKLQKLIFQSNVCIVMIYICIKIQKISQTVFNYIADTNNLNKNKNLRVDISHPDVTWKRSG